MLDLVLEVVHDVVRRVPAELVEAVEHDVPTDPEHRDDADDRDDREQPRHRGDQAAADLLGEARAALGQVQADVVHLHDHADHAVHGDGDHDRDDDQDHEPAEERLVGDLVERDHHDLGGQDEVGADRAGDHLLLGVLARSGEGYGVVVVPADPAPDLLRTLVAEVAAADHQDRGEQPRQELAEQQRRGEDEQQLVADRADRDPPDHRQLAVRGDTVDVLRRHRGVVDDDARGLRGRPARGSADVVDGGRRQPRERGDVVEQREQASSHARRLSATAIGQSSRPGAPRPPRPRPRPARPAAPGPWRRSGRRRA